MIKKINLKFIRAWYGKEAGEETGLGIIKKG
jgi:hypothetical protein